MRLTDKVGLYVVGIAILFESGCTISDADRCDDDHVWDEDLAICSPKFIDTGSDTGSDTQISKDSESGNSNMEGGLGTACTGNSDCSELTASFCMLDPRKPDVPGYCTVPNCDAPACGADYQCCDCSGAAAVSWDAPYCVENAGAQLMGMAGCTCQ